MSPSEPRVEAAHVPIVGAEPVKVGAGHTLEEVPAVPNALLEISPGMPA